MSFVKSIFNLIIQNKLKINKLLIFYERYNYIINYKRIKYSNYFFNNLQLSYQGGNRLNYYQKCTHKSSQNNFRYYLFGGIFGFFNKDKEEENPTITLLKRSVLLIQRGEFFKAERMLHLALKSAQEQQNFEAITYAYDLLANLAYDQEQYTKAEKLFKEILQRLLSTGTEKDDLKVINISLKLADIYNELNDNKALDGYLFCYNTLKKKLESGIHDENIQFLWSITLHHYGKFLEKMHKSKEALNLMLNAQEVAIGLFGKMHEMNVLLLNDMGYIHYKIKEFDKSIEFFKESLDISQKLEIEMPEKAEILMNLGMLYFEKELLNEAKKYLKESLKVAKKYENEKLIFLVKKHLNDIEIEFNERERKKLQI